MHAVNNVEFKAVEVLPEGKRFDDVLALASANKQTVGFLPDTAFRQRAERRTLGALVGSDNSTVGYILFDRVGPEVKIRHLCIDRDFRKRGLASILVDYVLDMCPEASALRLLCRLDYGLDEFWQSLGFSPDGERKGRGRKGDSLIAWVRPAAGANLFNFQPSGKIAFALDSDVFRDLHQDRDTSIESRDNLPDWIFEDIELVVTDALGRELIHERDPNLRKELLLARMGYRSVSPVAEKIVASRSLLTTAFANAGVVLPASGDLTHLVMCLAGGIENLLSRDADLRNKVCQVPEISKLIHVMHPRDVSRRVFEYTQFEDYQPANLASTETNKQQIGAGEFENLCRGFINTDDGEVRRSFDQLIASSSTPDWERWICYGPDKSVWLVWTIRREGTKSTISLLRCSKTKLARSALRTVVGGLRETEAKAGKVLVIADPFVGQAVIDDITEEGFVRSGDAWICVAAFGIYRSLSEARTAIHGLKAAVGAAGDEGTEDQRAAPGVYEFGGLRWPTAEFERRFAPAKILNGTVDNIIISIDAVYAQELFDSRLNAGTLFRREAPLGLAREHVYYRSAHAWPRIKLPARILWYVSKSANWQGSGTIRAASQLRDLVRGEAAVLTGQFRRLGVLDKHEVTRLSGAGQAMALQFSHTELFDQPVPLNVLRQVMSQDGKRLMLEGPTRISERFFETVYKLGMLHE